MELEHRRFQGLGLTHRIGEQSQRVQALRFLHRLLQVEFPLLKRPHSHPRLRCLGDPARRAGHVLDPIQFRLLPQHPPQILLLRLGQLRQFANQRGYSPWWQQILLRALTDLLWQQGAGGGRELIREPSHLLAGDLLPLVGRLRNHQLNLRCRLSRLHEGALGELIDARLLQDPFAEHVLRGFSQLNQSVGPGFADLALPQPLQETSSASLPTTFFAIADGFQNASTPDLRLQIEAVTDGPGLFQPGQELHGADVIAVRIRKIQLQRGRFGHCLAGQERGHQRGTTFCDVAR